MKLAIVFCALLVGCATQPQSNVYDAARFECSNLGFSQGTDAFANCVQRDVQHRRDIGMRMLYER